MGETEGDKTKERLFALQVELRLREAEERLGYTLQGLRKVIVERGAVGAALHLLDPAHGTALQAGIKKLAQTGLLHCSLEQVVLEFAQSAIFPDVIVRMARLRLTAALKLSSPLCPSCLNENAPSTMREGE